MFNWNLIKSIGEFTEVKDLQKVLDDNPNEVFTIVYFEDDEYKTCLSTDKLAKSIIDKATSVRMSSDKKVFLKTNVNMF